MSKATYNHMFTIAFEVGGSATPDGQDVTPQQLYDAIVKRAQTALREGTLVEAVGAPDDTYQEGRPSKMSDVRPQG